MLKEVLGGAGLTLRASSRTRFLRYLSGSGASPVLQHWQIETFTIENRKVRRPARGLCFAIVSPGAFKRELTEAGSLRR